MKRLIEFFRKEMPEICDFYEDYGPQILGGLTGLLLLGITIAIYEHFWP